MGKNISPKQKMKYFFNIAVYIVFLWMIIHFLLLGPNRSPASTIVGVLLVLAVIVLLYHDYLDSIYRKALYELNYRLNADEAKKLYARVISMDPAGIYKRDRALFDIMVYFEEKNWDGIIDAVKKNDEKFLSSVEMMLIRDFFLMEAYYNRGEMEEVRKLHDEIKDIEKMKKRPDPLPLEFYHAIYQLSKGSKEKAARYYSSVNVSRLNPRERKYLYQRKIETLGKANQIAQATKDLEKLKQNPEAVLE